MFFRKQLKQHLENAICSKRMSAFYQSVRRSHEVLSPFTIV